MHHLCRFENQIYFVTKAYLDYLTQKYINPHLRQNSIFHFQIITEPVFLKINLIVSILKIYKVHYY